MAALTVSHLSGKFGGHRHCGKVDKILICEVTSRDHTFKELYDFMGGIYAM